MLMWGGENGDLKKKIEGCASKKICPFLILLKSKRELEKSQIAQEIYKLPKVNSALKIK